MSFSQKFQGKVLVPWYNSSEWKYVYEILNNKNECDYPKVLEILKIWKIRSPLLSAGIEGTLIILEALNQNKDSLTDEQVVQIYSISLLRFLNLTAGNNDKQGYFNQTVKKHDLPKWLVDIRHDIAHNNRLPSRSILELSLNQCLNWTLEKYWEIQNKTICDYFVSQNPQDFKITELLGIYCELNITLHYKKDMSQFNEALFQKMNYMVIKRYSQPGIDFYGVLEILEEMLKQAMETVEFKNSSNDLVGILTTEKSLFSFIFEENVEQLENIPQSFKQIWTNLLNILIDNGFLFILLKKLHEITNDFLSNNSIKKASSLWIKEIFQALFKLKIAGVEDNFSNKMIKEFISSSEENYLHLKFNDEMVFNSMEFEKIILSSANVYTLDFLIFLLYYNGHLESEIEDTVKLVESMMLETYSNWEGEQFDGVQMEELVESDTEMVFEEETVPDKIINTLQNTKLRSKWSVVKNKNSFEGCPLGILPHQDRSKNPCLSFS